MTDKPSDTLYWTDVYLRSQEEFMRQWNQLGAAASAGANPFAAAGNANPFGAGAAGSPFAGAANPFASAANPFAAAANAFAGTANPLGAASAGAWGKTPWGSDWSSLFTPQFQGPSGDVARKYFGFFDQYLGASRAFADLLASSSANPDPSARAQEFTAGLTALQQPFSQMWHSLLAEQATATLPALGLTREHQEASERIRKLLLDLQQQQSALMALWSDVIGAALRAFGERVGVRLRAGEQFSSVKDLYDLWVESAELAYAKAAHGPEYAKAQADLGNTLAHLRIEQRKQVEAISKQLDLPTRDELNTVHHRLKDLKAQVRALQQQLRVATGSSRPSADKVDASNVAGSKSGKRKTKRTVKGKR